jgi:putative ATP-binding cassette transporter
MKLIAFLLKYSRRVVLLAVLAGIVGGACNTGVLALINASLNGGANSPSRLILAFIGLCVTLALTRTISEVLLARLGQGALFDLRMQLSRQILAVPLRRLEEVGAHRLLAALTEDLPTITNVVNMIPVICINIAVVIACLIYMGWLSWFLLLAVIGLILVGVLGYQFAVAKALRYLKEAREEGNMLYKHFHALMEGIKELKLHHQRRESFLSQVLQATAASFRKHNLTGLNIYTMASSWGQLLIFVIIGFLLFGLPRFQHIETATMTGFILTILYMMSPLQVIMNTLPTLGRGEVALKNVEQLGLTLATHGAESAALSSPRLPLQSLELAGVTHTFLRESDETSFVLGPVDMTLHPGELIFLVGGNGSGKTTLAKLVVGLYSPEEGGIWLNGLRVTDETREYYRQYFSVVFSDFYLFESLLGLETAELDEQARHYLAQLQLAHKVHVKDGALSTTDLSQGQRKRLALLTAYLEDRPIYVFDEWAADQDPMFKEIFYLQLLPELKARGKTVLVISHDDRYYHLADRVVKLDYGKVVGDDRGTQVQHTSAGILSTA